MYKGIAGDNNTNYRHFDLIYILCYNVSPLLDKREVQVNIKKKSQRTSKEKEMFSAEVSFLCRDNVNLLCCSLEKYLLK